MGLDMYLSATFTCSNYEHCNEAEKQRFAALLNAAELPEEIIDPQAPYLELDATVAYWRKANAIHAWFVRTVQDGKDECQTSFVARDELAKLAELCEQALMTQDPSALPPCDGFFFGSTEVDAGYWEDLKYTATRLRALLAHPALKSAEFRYRASW